MLIIDQEKSNQAMQRGLGGSHGAYKVRTQVPHTAPPHERLHQDRVNASKL